MMPLPSSSPDVIVVGSGPVGLTLACELLRHGASVRLIERRPAPVEHSHALVVHVRTQEILHAMGAIDGFLAHGHRLPGLIVRAEGKRIGRFDPTGVDGPYPGPIIIPQSRTEQFMAEHFAALGGSIEREVEAVGFEQDAAGVRVRLRRLAGGKRDGSAEETAAARWLVGCEGTDSLSRKTLGIPFEGERYSGEVFLMADVRVRWSHPAGYAYAFYAPERTMAFFPFDAKGFYRVLVMRRDDDPANRTPPTLEEMQACVRELADPSAELSDSAWLTRFRTGYRFAARFREGRAFLAGDSAHAHSPLGGQGMNYGMQDAFNLGWKLAAVARGLARPALLDTYETERQPVDEALVHGTDKAFHALTDAPSWASAAFRLLGPAVMKLPIFQHRLRDTMSEIRIAYPESALSEDAGEGGAIPAGARAVDATVVRWADGQTVRLCDDALRGPHWTLLLFAGTDPAPPEETRAGLDALAAALDGVRLPLTIHPVLTTAPPPAGCAWADRALMDAEHFAHDAYGVAAAPGLYLVRPDGYVGFRGRWKDAERLRAYLGRIEERRTSA